MQTIQCVIQESGGLCNSASLMVDRVTESGDLVLADKPMTLKRMGSTTTAGWGNNDDPAACVYGSEELGWRALIPRRALDRLGVQLPYKYSVERKPGGVTDATATEVASMDLGEFQGATDLPDGVEFARGLDADGRDVTVYRTIA